MSTVKTNTLTGTTSAGSIVVTGEGGSTTTNLQQGLCKHWVSKGDMAGNEIDGETFNNASYTDHNTGIARFNMTNPMSNALYMVVANTEGYCYNTVVVDSDTWHQANTNYQGSAFADSFASGGAWGDLA